MASNPDALTASDLETLAHQLADAAAALYDALEPAVAVQWRPAPVVRVDEGESRRDASKISDPTAAVALDDRRLALRAAVQQGARRMHGAARVFLESAELVTEALDDWSHGTEGNETVTE